MISSTTCGSFGLEYELPCDFIGILGACRILPKGAHPLQTLISTPSTSAFIRKSCFPHISQLVPGFAIRIQEKCCFLCFLNIIVPLLLYSKKQQHWHRRSWLTLLAKPYSANENTSLRKVTSFAPSGHVVFFKSTLNLSRRAPA